MKKRQIGRKELLNLADVMFEDLMEESEKELIADFAAHGTAFTIITPNGMKRIAPEDVYKNPDDTTKEQK